MDDKVFIFSREEFIVLVAASGIRQMYGFSIYEELDDQNALQAMQNLVAKGQLLSVEGKFQVQEPVASLFLQMKEAKTTMDVHKRSGKKCIVYIGTFAVKVSLSRRGKGMLEVQGMMLSELWKHLTEEGWIPIEKGETR